MNLEEKRKTHLKSSFLVPTGEAPCIETLGVLTSIITTEY